MPAPGVAQPSSVAWFALALAGVLEVAWATTMKASDGFRKPLLAVATVLLMLASFSLLAFAMRSLPLGTSYAVWTGIGAVGAAIVGMVWLGEPRTVIRIACVVAIVVGIFGLRLTHAPVPAT
ncbi:MAG TPA: multidrug efflux SMR transporter [Candidatus Thermoplasmatota archaeon]|nr:multidrug efflux SMR transporter [Candidatus Thermoplasmatota archaeon]